MARRASLERTGFRVRSSSIRGGVFLPRYYDPGIADRLTRLARTHRLLTLGELIDHGHVLVATGDEIGKMAYGTGSIPFVRTSDVSNWEVKTDPKQGVSEQVYADYASAQDVRANDILFVRDGTYLIGQLALVTESDLPMLYQSHLLKLRVKSESPVTVHLLMACLSAPVVKAQIRAKQFTADIIDTIGDRFRELVLPIPRDERRAANIADEVEELTRERARLREKIRKIPLWTQGAIAALDAPLPGGDSVDMCERGNPGFALPLSAIKNDIFIPKYYDPELDEDLRRATQSHRTVSLGQLVESGVLSWETGIEVGKMAYGTGAIPFVRTSDISNWELKGDPKQGVSERIYRANAQNVKADDILVVRDGTYLVGASCILTQHDTKMLYCGGLYKLRVEKPEQLDPFLLLACLNTPLARRQMRAKKFTRDIIDTLGKRLFEVVVPIPRSVATAARIAHEVRDAIETRTSLRERTKAIAMEVEGDSMDRG